MTEMRDPIEIYRQALASIPARVETAPPALQRVEVWPYPDLQRVWVRLQTTEFADFPNLCLTLTDPEGQVVSVMFMVEIRERYQSVTLHLRQPPRPSERYQLEIELSRAEQVLDTRVVPFDLVFREPTLEAGGAP